ncbi:MAG: class I SAM-dependent methyltransferase [Thermodesulfovibrionales bacterium]
MDNLLEKKITGLILERGPMTFERFMETALYDPELGYYCSPDLEIGKAGDFYTSSHLHPVFGVMVGRQIMEMWEFMARPERFTLVEVGGGTGHICADILDSLKEGQFFDALQYIIVEISPAMRKKQQVLLAAYAAKVSWVSCLEELAPFRGCIFSNELIDAFPVHLVEMGDELTEIYVNTRAGALVEEAGPLSTQALADYFREFHITIEQGYRTEVNLRARQWLQDVSEKLLEGFVLTIDYGYNTRDYYSEDRDRGTLLCYHRHQAGEDPLQHIGQQDITAHVNFSALKKWGENAGLRARGFSSQGAFLVSLGIDAEISRLAEQSPDYPVELARIKKLILPQGMGDSHMVMLQYKGNGEPVLKGFSLRDQTRHL